MRANSYYFGHPKWAEHWLRLMHRYPELKQRWQAVIGTWDSKVVVDIGCGPGNLYAALRGSPKLLIGVDVSRGALEMAQQNGYTPLLADAHDLPLVSHFADIVALNATLHHCDNMAKVLSEAARLTRPGGILVVDHEPNRTAYDLKALGLFLWRARVPIYRLLNHGGHSAEENEQTWAIATEIHHKPGDGVTPELYRRTLEPRGFQVQLYPHNHRVGVDLFHGNLGRAPFKMRITQRLSGINPNSAEAAMSLMCVATLRV